MGHTSRALLPLVFAELVSCSTAPTQNIMGSFFPAWLLCIAIGLVAAAVLRLVLGVVGAHSYVAAPLLTYVAAALATSMLIWLVWFGH